MYSFDYSDWHKGHNVEVFGDNGKLYANCMDCRVVVEIPTASRKLEVDVNNKSKEVK